MTLESGAINHLDMRKAMFNSKCLLASRITKPLSKSLLVNEKKGHGSDR